MNASPVAANGRGGGGGDEVEATGRRGAPQGALVDVCAWQKKESPAKNIFMVLPCFGKRPD